MLNLKLNILIDKMIVWNHANWIKNISTKTNVVGTQKESCSKEMVLKHMFKWTNKKIIKILCSKSLLIWPTFVCCTLRNPQNDQQYDPAWPWLESANQSSE